MGQTKATSFAQAINNVGFGLPLAPQNGDFREFSASEVKPRVPDMGQKPAKPWPLGLFRG